MANLTRDCTISVSLTGHAFAAFRATAPTSLDPGRLSYPITPAYILNTLKLVFSIGALSAHDRPKPSTMRVSAGSITPSSHSLALA